MRISVALLLAAGMLLCQDQPGVIEGVVVDSVTKMPLRKSQVMMNSMGMGPQVMRAMSGRNVIGSAPPQMPPQPASAMTDVSGTFAFRDLAPGTYNLLISNPKYPMQRSGMMNKTVTVKSGETARMTVELVPPVVVSGRITDEDGDPLPGCMVQVRSPDLPFMGNFQNQPSDETGEYRLWGIEAGKYVVSAQCMRQPFQPRPLSPATPGQPPAAGGLAYPIQIYPLSKDMDGGEVLVLAPGSEKSGVDFRMKPERVFEVSGNIRLAGAEWHGPSGLVLRLIPKSSTLMNPFNNNPVQVDSAKGTYRIMNVFPGSYTISGFSAEGNAENRVGVKQTVDVSDRSLQVNLDLQRGSDLTGTIQIEGNTEDAKIPMNQISIQFLPTDPMGMPPPQARPSEDGSFSAKGVLPSAWTIQVYGPKVFLKSITVGGQPLAGRVLDTTSGATGPIRLLLSTKTATLRGTAPAGQMIQVMEAEENPMMGSRRHGTAAGPDGTFNLQGLSPGKYRVVLGQGNPQSADAQNSTTVTLAEGETSSVELKAGSDKF